MDRSSHTLACLFSQLGLNSTEKGIEKFIIYNHGIPDHLRLHQSDIWNQSQANFLYEAIQDDSDWAEIVDSLDTLLR